MESGENLDQIDEVIWAAEERLRRLVRQRPAAEAARRGLPCVMFHTDAVVAPGYRPHNVDVSVLVTLGASGFVSCTCEMHNMSTTPEVDAAVADFVRLHHCELINRDARAAVVHSDTQADTETWRVPSFAACLLVRDSDDAEQFFDCSVSPPIYVSMTPDGHSEGYERHTVPMDFEIRTDGHVVEQMRWCPASDVGPTRSPELERAVLAFVCQAVGELIRAPGAQCVELSSGEQDSALYRVSAHPVYIYVKT
jgi:hypothetical protein